VDVADAIDRARRLQDDGKADEALELLLAAAREHPDDEDLDAEVALFYTERGLRRPEAEALADFAEAQKWMELPITLAAEAGIRVRRGELEKAEGLLGQALEADPDLLEARVALGRLWMAKGDPARAAEVLGGSLKLWPGSPASLVGLAEALRDLGRKGEALVALREAAARCPGDDRVLAALGQACAEADDVGGAREAWTRAAQMNRTNVDAWRGAAWAAARSGDELEMHRALDRAIELDPDGTRAWLEKEKSAVPLLATYAR